MPLLNIRIPGTHRSVEVIYKVEVDTFRDGQTHKAEVSLPLPFLADQWEVNHILMVVANDLGRDGFRLLYVQRVRNGKQDYQFVLESRT